MPKSISLGLRQGAQDAQGGGAVQDGLVPEQLLEGDPLHVLHHDVVLRHVVDLHDVGVGQDARGLRLAPEAPQVLLARVAREVLRAHGLDGHRAAHQRVVGAEHAAHGPLADLVADLVAAELVGGGGGDGGVPARRAPGHAAGEPPELVGMGDARQHLAHPLEVHRLGEVVGGPAPHRLHRRLHRPLRGHQDHLGGGAAGHVAEQLQPAAVGQVHVHEEDVGRPLGEELARFAQGAGGARGEVLQGHHLGQALREMLVVVHEQRVRHRSSPATGGRAEATALYAAGPS
jgi:hypothetical protein